MKTETEVQLVYFLSYFTISQKLPFSPLPPPPPLPHSRMDRKKGILQMTSSYYLGTGRIGHKLIGKRFEKLQLDNIC